MNWFNKLLKLGLKRKKEPKRFVFWDYAYYHPSQTWTDLEVFYPNGKQEWAAVIMTLEDHQQDLCDHVEHNFDFAKCNDPRPPQFGFQKHIDDEGRPYYSAVFKTKTLSLNEYLETARAWMKEKGFYDQEFKIEFVIQSQKEIDEENKRWEDWVKNGCKPYKILFAPEFWDSMKKMGATNEEIEEMKKRFQDKNKENGFNDENE